jgi:hypothetical protein
MLRAHPEHRLLGSSRDNDAEQDVGPRQKRNLAGHEHAENEADEQSLRCRETPFRKDIAVEGAEQRRYTKRIGDDHELAR